MRWLPVLTLALASLLCLAAAAGQPGWQSEAIRQARALAKQEAQTPPVPAQVGLLTLAASPGEWLGREVRFEVQMRALVPTWNPYLTRFGTQDYVAARVWADEQMLWDKESFDHPAAVLFARRGSTAAEELAAAGTYARFAVSARVEQVFGGRPWIEVQRAQRLPEAMTEGAILHAARALQALAAGEKRLASENLQRALASWPPERARAELERLSAAAAAQ